MFIPFARGARASSKQHVRPNGMGYLEPMSQNFDRDEPQRTGFGKVIRRDRNLSEMIRTSHGVNNLANTVRRMVATGIHIPSPVIDPEQFKAPEINFQPDDSPQRTADHTEAMSTTMADMLEVTKNLAQLTQTNLEQSQKAERRTFWLTIVSITIGVASAGAAITSVILFITNNG